MDKNDEMILVGATGLAVVILTPLLAGVVGGLADFLSTSLFTIKGSAFSVASLLSAAAISLAGYFIGKSYVFK